MIYVLAYPKFNEQISQRLENFRCVHEADRARLVRPHLTLVFGVNQKYAEDMVALCEQVADSTASISLVFSKSEIIYDSFEKVYKISLVCSEGADLITDMHERFYQGLPQSERNSDVIYRPHMTVGTNVDVSKLEDVDVSTIGAFPIEAECNRLSIVELNGNELQAIKSFEMLQ